MFLTIIIIIGTLLTGCAGTFFKMRKEEKDLWGWNKLTGTGRFFVIVFCVTLIASITKAYTDEYEKQETQIVEATHRERVEGDLTSIKDTLLKLGMKLMKEGDEYHLYINNFNLFSGFAYRQGVTVQNFYTTPSPVKPHDEEKPDLVITDSSHIKKDSASKEDLVLGNEKTQDSVVAPPPGLKPPPKSNISFDIDKSLKNGSGSYYQANSTVTFVNEKKYDVMLYSGGRIGGGGGSNSATFNLGPGRTETTNQLFVGYVDHEQLPGESPYIFYFTGTDENNQQVYGSVTVNLKPYYAFTVTLDDYFLKMRPNGDRNKNALAAMGMKY